MFNLIAGVRSSSPAPSSRHLAISSQHLLGQARAHQAMRNVEEAKKSYSDAVNKAKTEHEKKPGDLQAKEAFDVIRNEFFTFLNGLQEPTAAANVEEHSPTSPIPDQLLPISRNDATPQRPLSAQRAQDASIALSKPDFFEKRSSLSELGLVQAATPAEEKSGLVDYLFEKALSTLGSLEVSNKPSLFLVYAHDNPSYGKAEAAISRYLIDKLSQIRVNLYSDQTPMGQLHSSLPQALKADSKLEDILISQLCLLPTQLREDVEPVYKVVVCCSEVLGKYLKDWPYYDSFYQHLREAYRQDCEKLGTSAIREVIRKFSQDEKYKAGFHHVLTEMAFLQIRAEQLRDQHGIIPVSLTPKSYQHCLAHFVERTRVRMDDISRFEEEANAGRAAMYPNQSRHWVLFKLIERLLVNSDEAKTFLNQFWQGYSTCLARLKDESTTFDELEFVKLVDAIFDGIRTELHRRIAFTAQQFCDPVRQQAMTQLDRKIDHLTQTLEKNQVEQKQALQSVPQPLAILGDNIEQFKQAYKVTLKDTGEWDVLSMYVPLQGLKDKSGDQAPIDLETELDRFFESDASVFLLLGAAGTGKSTFNRHMALKKLEQYQRLSETDQDPPLVFFVELRSIENPHKKVIDQFLLSKNFTAVQIELLRTHLHQRCIFIFDGYDEINERNRNFYELNELARWKNAKFVIASRPEYLDPNYQPYFCPKGAPHAFREAWMAPFSAKQRSHYIKNYVEKTCSTHTVEEYEHAFRQLTLLEQEVERELERPIVLRMLFEILPEYMATGQNPKNLTLGAVYEKYFQKWWGNWKSRLSIIPLTPAEEAAKDALCEATGGFIQQGFEYMQDCALALTKEKKFVAEQNKRFQKQHEEIYDAFFEESAKIRLLRFSAPLQRNSDNHYRFSHTSMQEYLVARAICPPDFKCIAPHPTDAINQLSLVEQPVILDFLVEQIKQKSDFKAHLYDWINVSKDPKIPVAIGSANAITVLVRAGMTFNGTDLRGIRIPGADLSGGVFDHAQLQGADLNQAHLRAIWLRNANLSGAQMAGVQFGEWPFLEEESGVLSCAYSRDGKLFAAGLRNGNISVYATLNWEKIFTLHGHTEEVESVAYSPKGDRIVSGSRDKTVRVWNVETRNLLHVLEGHSHWVESVAYSPIDDRISSGGWDNTVRIWDANTKATLRVFCSHSERVESVVYSSTGDRIASSSADKTVQVWSPNTGEVLHTLHGHSSGVTSIAYSPNDDQIAAGSWDGAIQIWNAYTGDVLQILCGHSNRVQSLAYSSTGHRLVSGSQDKTVRVWDVKTGKTLQTLRGHNTYPSVNCVAYSPTDDQIVSGSIDQTMRLWNVNTGTSRQTFSGHSSDVTGVAYSLKGDRIASSCRDGTVRIWDRNTGAALQTLRGQPGLSSVAYSSKEGQIATGSYHNAVQVWDVNTGEVLQTLGGHSNRIENIAYSPKGDQIASAGYYSKTVEIWNVETGKLVHVLAGHTHKIMSVAYSPRDSQIASASIDQTVRIWDVNRGEVLYILEGHSKGVRSVAYSPQSDQLASASIDQTVKVWDLNSRKVLQTFCGHSSWVISVVFSPQGDRVASASNDRTVRVWDITTGQCQIIIQGFNESVTSIDWKETDNSHYLVTGSDESVRQWKLIKEGNQYKAVLCWASAENVLTLAGTIIEGTQDLSKINKQLLIQRGAMKNPLSLDKTAKIAPELKHY